MDRTTLAALSRKPLHLGQTAVNIFPTRLLKLQAPVHRTLTPHKPLVANAGFPSCFKCPLCFCDVQSLALLMLFVIQYVHVLEWGRGKEESVTFWVPLATVVTRSLKIFWFVCFVSVIVSHCLCCWVLLYFLVQLPYTFFLLTFSSLPIFPFFSSSFFFFFSFFLLPYTERLLR